MTHSHLPSPVLTPLSERIGLRYPLVSAPMFLISNPAMLIASAEAGILGAMPSLNARDTEGFRGMLREIQQSTKDPFAINLTIGLTDPDRLKADLHACIDHGVKVLITSYGDPTEIVAEAHRHDMLVLHDVISLRHALKAQSAGVDAIIGVSAGAGGHGGTISPFAFIPWLKSELHVPVVAAGCISDGRQVLSALSLGAELCYMGTRFIASTECGAPDAYKEMVSSASPEEIVYTDKVSGIHANFLRATLPEEGPRTREAPQKRWRDIWSAGHGVAQIHDTQPIAAIVHQVMNEYRETLDRLALHHTGDRAEDAGSTATGGQAAQRAVEARPKRGEVIQATIPLQVAPRHPEERFNLTEILLDVHLDEGRGDHVALICPEGEWSYAALAGQVTEKMRQLKALGVREEERVLIAVSDGVDFVSGLLAIIRSGAVAVMLNPELEESRVLELMSYSRARVAIVEAEQTEQIYRNVIAQGGQVQHLICVLGQARSSVEHVSGTPLLPCVQTHRDDPAIWLFSGGTTGRPKAIIQSHRSFLYTTERYGRGVMGYGESDRTLSVPKLYFGYATGANLIFTLAGGGTSILFPDRPTPERLFELIETHRPTLLINVPTVINRMVSDPSAPSRDLSSLRAVTSAGEALPNALAEAWGSLYDAPLCDGLGTAEMWHIFITNHPTDARHRRAGTLGHVVEGFEVSLRDPEDLAREVPDGQPGVMWVRGGARALGYWQQDEATQESFQGEWYASGDLMIRDAEGFYTFCGRSDDMIKVAGKFASPKEVEDCLMTYDGVEECAVVGRPDEAGLMKLFAFITLKKSWEASVEDTLVLLSDYLHARLDSYKLPKKIFIMDQLPKTHLGKISRGALKV